ncbi:hypothetical protein C7B82_14125 [Stenomitos frigidus ULC18]|uniref:Response regulatory domain-containing protein n=1 Tax=Stenomitos frigidus ULC18 TaxID=2107698 RepID=A0A2T1E671_9CYAN|nr:hypothetical protein C7B82_14125 [Stenomitos frigidus ULC18]
MMPDMGGFTCCRQLCQSEQPYPGPILLALTQNEAR